MTELFLTILVLSILIAGMAIGVIMGRRPLQGSCGGVGKALGEEDYVCDICGGDPDKCESSTDDVAGNSRQQAKDLAYELSEKR